MSKQISNGVNKIILIILAGILLLAGLVWIARPDSQDSIGSSDKSNGMLTVEEMGYDFGVISMGAGNVSHQFKVKNTSSQGVMIKKMYTSCMCTSAALMMGGRRFGPYGMPGHGAIPRIDQTLNPNEEATIEVTFDPAAHGPAGVGKIQRTIIVENNAGQSLELNFTALVTP